jgi:hypothetical protein
VAPTTRTIKMLKPNQTMRSMTPFPVLSVAARELGEYTETAYGTGRSPISSSGQQPGSSQRSNNGQGGAEVDARRALGYYG